MEGGNSKPEPSVSSHRSSPVARGPSTPTSSSPIVTPVPKGSGHSVLADRYAMGEELGRGAHGRVYKAFDKEDNKFVAVKEISLTGVSKEKLNGVVGEIDLLKNLDHTNIVQYFDSVKTNNHLYIILEYMESGSLASLIKPTNCGVFAEHQTALIVAQVLQGLKYLHAQGVVHRDIKGANILTTKDMVIKLADFGVAAKLFDRGGKGNKHGYYNTIAGSPYWIAPEVIGLESVTTAADIWSIGCLIVELLTGSPPYFDCQPFQALYRIVQDEHPPLPETATPTLRSFLLLCFDKEPESRPSAEDLLKHDWITERLDRSVSPPTMMMEHNNHENSQENIGYSHNVTDVLEKIFKHNRLSRNKKPTNAVNRQELVSESDQAVSKRTAGSSPASTTIPIASDHHPHPGSSSVASTATTPLPSVVAVHDHPSNSEIQESEVDRENAVVVLHESSSRSHYNSTEKRKQGTSPVPQPTLLGGDKDPEQSRTGSVSNSDTASGVLGLRRKDWRDDTPSNDKDATSTHVASGTSSPDARLLPRSAPPVSSHKEETELSVIFSDKISEFDSQPNRPSTNETWGHVYETTMSPQSPTSCSGRSQICPPRGREHYNPSDIKRVLRSLQPHLPLTSIVPALRDLVNLIKHDAEAKTYFINEDGLLVLLEFLLLFKDLFILEHTLILINLICGDDFTMLRDASAIGLAAEIFHFTDSGFPLSIRKEAAKFLYSMCFTSVKSMDHLIKCQGLKWLIMLFEDGQRKELKFRETAVDCIFHILEVQGIGMENRILRMLCMADLPRKLIAALISLHQNYDELTCSRFQDPENYQDGLMEEKSSSGCSLSEACIPCSLSDLSSQPSHQVPSSDESHHSGEEFVLQGTTTPTVEQQQHLQHPYDINQSPVQTLSEKMIDLLLKICTSQAEVHRHFCMEGLLPHFHDLLRLPSMELVHRVVVCLKYLSMRPTVVENLQDAETVCRLIPLLGQRERSEITNKIHRECLIVIDNICKCNPLWRDKAVQHGIVPYLCNLSRSPVEIESQTDSPEDDGLDVRRFSVPLLCRLLNVSSQDTRQVFWEHDVINLFLELLHEDKWHKVVLKALATWLEEDIHHVEPKLISSATVQHLISILRKYRYLTSNEISAVLNPIQRMLVRSDKLSRKAGLSGLAQVVLDMLEEVDAQTCLLLLRTLTRLYGMYPRPKEFIKKYSVEQYLEHLANSTNSQTSDRVLIQKEISDLTNAFQMNQIW